MAEYLGIEFKNLVFVNGGFKKGEMLVNSAQSMVGRSFVQRGSGGQLRQVKDLAEVRELGRRSGERLRAIFKSGD